MVTDRTALNRAAGGGRDNISDTDDDHHHHDECNEDNDDDDSGCGLGLEMYVTKMICDICFDASRSEFETSEG